VVRWIHLDDDAHITANPCIVGPLGLKESGRQAPRGFAPGVDHLLGGTRALGLATAAVSPRQCFAARGVRGCAVAGFTEFASAGRVAGRGALGAAPGAGGIGGVDHRAKKHAIRIILPAIDSLFRQRIKSQRERQS